MYVGTLPPVSTRAGWSIVREVVDDDTDESIDLTGATIAFEVRDQRDGAIVLSATTGNGKVTVTDTGVFQVNFPASEMRELEPGIFDVGCTVQMPDEEPQQFILGTLPVLDGVVT